MLDKSSNTIAWYESQTCLFQKQPIQPFAICHLTCPHVRHQGWFLLQVNTWLIVLAQKLWRIQTGKCRITLLHCYLMCDFVLRLYLSAEIWVHAIVLHTSGSDLGSHHITDANVSFSLSELPYFHMLLLDCAHLPAVLFTSRLAGFCLSAFLEEVILKNLFSHLYLWSYIPVTIL